MLARLQKGTKRTHTDPGCTLQKLVCHPHLTSKHQTAKLLQNLLKCWSDSAHRDVIFCDLKIGISTTQIPENKNDARGAMVKFNASLVKGAVRTSVVFF